MFGLLCGEPAHDCTTVPRVPAETQLSRVCVYFAAGAALS